MDSAVFGEAVRSTIPKAGEIDHHMAIAMAACHCRGIFYAGKNGFGAFCDSQKTTDRPLVSVILKRPQASGPKNNALQTLSSSPLEQREISARGSAGWLEHWLRS